MMFPVARTRRRVRIPAFFSASVGYFAFVMSGLALSSVLLSSVGLRVRVAAMCDSLWWRAVPDTVSFASLTKSHKYSLRVATDCW